MLEGNTSDEASSNNSASDFSDGTPSPPADVDITYSFDASRGPTQGNQIFNVALAQAVEKFEERETVKLVKNEYDVLDADGESVAAPARKTQAKARGMGATRVLKNLATGVDLVGVGRDDHPQAAVAPDQVDPLGGDHAGLVADSGGTGGGLGGGHRHARDTQRVAGVLRGVHESSPRWETASTLLASVSRTKPPK